MSSTIRPASVITRSSRPSVGRRGVTAAIALAVSIGLAIGVDPFGLIASASEGTVALGLIATEAVAVFLLAHPMIAAVIDFVAARRGLPRSGGSGDGGGPLEVWWTMDGGDGGGGGASGGHGGGGAACDAGGGGDCGGGDGGGGD